MRKTLLAMLAATAFGLSPVVAQGPSTMTEQPRATNPAPPQSPDAQGHDVQSGRPETGPGPAGNAQDTQRTTDEANKAFIKDAEKQKR